MGTQHTSSGTWRAQLMSQTGNPHVWGHRGPLGPSPCPIALLPERELVPGSRKELPPAQTRSQMTLWRCVLKVHSLPRSVKDSRQIAHLEN